MTWCFQINKTILENPVFANENPNARITDPDTIKSKGFNTVFTSPLYAHLSMHGCYAALVLGDENNGGDGDGGYGQVLDFLHLWSILETDAHLNGSDEQQLNDADAAAMMMGSLHRGYAFELFMLGRISGSGKSATAIGDEMQVYTCEDEKKMVEFLQRFSLQNTILPVPKASSSGGGDGGSSSRSSSDPKKVATEVLKVMLKDNIKEGSSPAASASISASESPSSHLTSGNDSNTTTPISKSKKSSPTTTTTLYSESAQLAGLAVAVVAVAIFLYLAGF